MGKDQLPGLNIQYPISSLIVSGEKTVETRTYDIPDHYKGVPLYLVETPGKNGKFKARIVAVIEVVSTFKYETKKAFYNDFSKHGVDPKSNWRWEKSGKWGWNLKVHKVFQRPKAVKGKRGIIFSRSIEAM